MLCAEHLRPALDDVARAFHDRIMNDTGIELELAPIEMATTEKPRQLLLPDGPLAWNAKTSDDDLAMDVDPALDMFTSLDDFQNVEWDGNWDLADLLGVSDRHL